MTALSRSSECAAIVMTLLLFCFLLGCVAGLRSLTAPAVVCWAAHLGWLHFSGTKLAFINQPSTLIVFTLLAVVELIADKLPKTPARTAPLGLIARIVVGGSIGVALATSSGMSVPFPMMVAAIGGLGECALRINGASEFTALDDEGVIEQAALFEIHQ